MTKSYYNHQVFPAPVSTHFFPTGPPRQLRLLRYQRVTQLLDAALLWRGLPVLGGQGMPRPRHAKAMGKWRVKP